MNKKFGRSQYNEKKLVAVKAVLWQQSSDFFSETLSFVFFFSRDVFLSYVDVTITVDGLQISYTRHALMAIEQWGFFSVPHLLSHGVSIYNGNLKGPVTLARLVM